MSAQASIPVRPADSPGHGDPPAAPIPRMPV